MAKRSQIDIAWREPSPREAEPAAKRVAIWIRVSTEDQARGESPEHHEHRARAYAEIRGWEVVTLYNLAGVSGKAVLSHPEARRMMEDVKAGRISGLIFSKIARLARNTRELLEFAEFFQAQGADLISLEESIDTSTPAGRFFYTMIAGMASWEREEIASRVAASVPVRAKLGKPLGGAAPFGYRWHEKRLVPDPEEAPIRRLIYELYIEHRRMLTVARLLNDRGCRTRGGGTFTHTTVERLIRDPTAKGTRRANYTKSRGQGKGWNLKPETDWIEIPVEAIVPEDLWNAANALLAEKRGKGTKAAPKRAVQIFGGLTFCHCGAKMYFPGNTPKYVCTRKGCRTKVPLADLERIFQVELRRFALSPEDVRATLSEADEKLRAKIDLLESLWREDAHLAEEAEQVYRLYLAGELDPKGFGARNRPLAARRDELEAEIPRLQGEIDFLRIQQLSQEEVVSAAEDLSTRWYEIPLEERRSIVQAIVERVTVGKDEIEFSLTCLPSGPPSPSSPPFPQDGEKRCMNPQRFIHKLAPCRVTLRGCKSRPGNPEDPKTLGEHLVPAPIRWHTKTPDVAFPRASSFLVIRLYRSDLAMLPEQAAKLLELPGIETTRVTQKNRAQVVADIVVCDDPVDLSVVDRGIQDLVALLIGKILVLHEMA
jgi:site-specific DNA recombinase